MGEGLALGQVGDNNGYEADGQEIPDKLQHALMGTFPYLDREAFEELADKNPRNQDQPAPNGATMDAGGREVGRDDIVGTVQEDDMDKRNAPKERNQTGES
ncbi:hypothetical protein BP6252_04078 [Coleophoma cylindrospora]|uniref:Uncharacterized protein n=1 Tax=Coleophoma cylindrospora TaxID=1849047 RepID=A0A3D8S003_9HELO|nr:hypothetical protein BP6252_04078 [Coleophoma cylindrospora]